MQWLDEEAVEQEGCSALDLLAGEEDEAEEGGAAPEPAARLALTPRVYQEDALTAWEEAGGRGVVVLPTGAGKTVLALMAIARAGVRPLVIVPTIELLKQWTDALQRHLGLPSEAVGQVGGGVRHLRAATVITY